MTQNQQVFFDLIKAGLWEKDVSLSKYGEIDFEEVYRLAQEQSVVGVLAAGMEKVVDVRVPQPIALNIAGEVLQIEQRNKDMNIFIADLVEKMRTAGIYAILMKGQGIAQCYTRPLWRSCGDIDFFLSPDNYEKAKSFLLPMGNITSPEEVAKRHFAIMIEQWTVELHGTLHGGLSFTTDKVIDKIQNDIIYTGNVRSWINGRTQVFLPGADCDAVYVFSHILQHFFKGGIGLRQICDWSRCIWIYKDSLDLKLLEKRIHNMKLMSEWNAFAALVVDYLGMPIDAMPLYSNNKIWKKKSERILSFIMDVGNFGHNRDLSYYRSKLYFSRKVFSAWSRLKDIFNHASIFPLDCIRFFVGIMYNGVVSTIRGE